MGFQDREKRRTGKSVAASMILQSTEKPASGRGRPKAKRETKKRVTFSILPSLYEQAKEIAFIERRSMSEVVGECLSKYIEEHQNEIK